MNPARYDFLIIVGDDDFDVRFLRNSTSGEVQQWIEDHLLHTQHFRVRQISLDEYARDVTDEFFPARDLDAPRLAFHRSGIAA